MTLTYQKLNILRLISAPKIDSDLLWNLSILFVILAVLFFVGVFFYRSSLTAKGVLERNRKREFSPMISEFLFHEAESTKEENTNYVNLKIEIRQLLKDDFNRKILSEILLDLRKDVAGETQKRVFKLYKDLGLHNDAFEKLKSKRWQVVSKAILDLTQMQVIEAYSFVTKFINDKRTTIRRQAEIATVTLKPEGINYFLDTTKYKISEWQQLKILDVLRMEEDFLPPPFKAWLTSTNRHVVLFALRLIKFYSQNDAKPALIELVKHRNSQIKEEAIACIKEFHVTEALDTLKLVFWKCSTDVKIAILDAIGFLGSEDDITFLRLIEKKEANFYVKSKAYSSINTIAPDSIMPSKGLLDPTNYTIPADLLVEPIDIDEEPPLSIEELEQPKEQSSLIQTKQVLEEISIPEKTTMNKTESTEKNEQKSENSEQLSYEFLPIVVQEDIAVSNIEINEIEVNISNESSTSDEEITKQKDKDNVSNIFSIEVRAEELEFLPIVTDNKVETTANSLDLDVFNTIISDLDDDAIIKNEPSIKEQDIASGNYSEFNNSELLDIQVNYDEISHLEDTVEENQNQQIENSPLLEFDNEFIDISDFEKNNEDDNNLNLAAEENQKEEIDNQSKATIPNSILRDEFQEKILLSNENTEEAKIQLLEDISEMGDERELPLLEEMLLNDTYKDYKEHIQKIIENFSEDLKKVDLIDIYENFNVFEDLFRNCDVEAKLILMDEIVAIGDESEIEFLEGLLKKEKEDQVIDKAKQALIELRAKLLVEKEELPHTTSIETNTIKTDVHVDAVLSEHATYSEYDSLLQELEIEPSQEENDMFDLTFELTNPNETEERTEITSSAENKNPSILNQILSIPNKIIEKLNG